MGIEFPDWPLCGWGRKGNCSSVAAWVSLQTSPVQMGFSQARWFDVGWCQHCKSCQKCEQEGAACAAGAHRSPNTMDSCHAVFQHWLLQDRSTSDLNVLMCQKITECKAQAKGHPAPSSKHSLGSAKLLMQWAEGLLALLPARTWEGSQGQAIFTQHGQPADTVPPPPSCSSVARTNGQARAKLSVLSPCSAGRFFLTHLLPYPSAFPPLWALEACSAALWPYCCLSRQLPPSPARWAPSQLTKTKLKQK